MTPLFHLLNVAGGTSGLTALLPGPDRKRSAVAYTYHILHRAADPRLPGCVVLWEVTGGRLDYQIALERSDAGNLRLHCSCADAIYRGEDQPHFCKHVHGLMQLARPRNARQSLGA